MILEQLLGFDARRPVATVDGLWTAARREQFLLRGDVSRPLSVDTLVWPSLFDTGTGDWAAGRGAGAARAGGHRDARLDGGERRAVGRPRGLRRYLGERGVNEGQYVALAVSWLSDGGLAEAGAVGPYRATTAPPQRGSRLGTVGLRRGRWLAGQRAKQLRLPGGRGGAAAAGLGRVAQRLAFVRRPRSRLALSRPGQRAGARARALLRLRPVSGQGRLSKRAHRGGCAEGAHKRRTPRNSSGCVITACGMPRLTGRGRGWSWLRRPGARPASRRPVRMSTCLLLRTCSAPRGRRAP